MEEVKVTAFKNNKGNWDSNVEISYYSKTEILWWKENVRASYTYIETNHGEPNFAIFTDASLTRWACSCELGGTIGVTGTVEATDNINVLELKAAFFALQCFLFLFAKDESHIHIRLIMIILQL